MLVDRCTGVILSVLYTSIHLLRSNDDVFFNQRIASYRGVFFRPWALPGECDGGSSNQIQALFNSQKFHVLMFWYYMF